MSAESLPNVCPMSARAACDFLQTAHSLCRNTRPLNHLRGSGMERATGLEPATFSLGSRAGAQHGFGRIYRYWRQLRLFPGDARFSPGLTQSQPVSPGLSQSHSDLATRIASCCRRFVQPVKASRRV